MRIWTGFVAALAIAAVTVGETSAQQRRKDAPRKSETESSTPAKSGIGYPKCEGGIFFIHDGGDGGHCRRSDGKVCDVRDGGGGRVNLINCR